MVVTRSDIKILDEVFIATALLHREQPDRQDFTISEIVERANRENLFGKPRPGVRSYASSHCVANRPPSPNRYGILYATGERTRRLLLAPVQPIAAGVIMMGAVAGTRLLLPQTLPELVTFGILVAVGAATYGGVLFVLFRGLAMEVLQIFRRAPSPAG